MSILRKVFCVISLSLILIIGAIQCWFKGYDAGYSEAMSDVLFNIDTPEKYFTKRFDIRLPPKVQHKQETGK